VQWDDEQEKEARDQVASNSCVKVTDEKKGHCFDLEFCSYYEFLQFTFQFGWLAMQHC